MDENMFIDGEREIRKKYHILLLADLIKYYIDNNVSFKIDNIINSLQDSIVYEVKEIEELKSKAKKVLLDKYDIEI